MILSYNWQILQSPPAEEQQIKALARMPTPEQQQFFGPESPSNTIQPTSLRLPIFGFLFCYYIEQPKSSPPEVELQAQVTVMEEPVALRVVRVLRWKNCIYQELMVESSEVHDLLLALNVRIKYHPLTKPLRIGNVDSLIRLAGTRLLNLSSASTYATIRKELIIQSPVGLQHRHSDGLLLLKIRCEGQQKEEVEIRTVQVMNWLAVGNEAVKREVVTPLLNGTFQLKGKETYALPFKLQGSLAGVQLPIAVTYCLPPEKKQFKMVKIIRGESSE